MESVGKRQRQVRITEGKQVFIPGESSARPGHVHLPISYTENLTDKFSCPNEEETPLGPANVHRLLNFAPVQQKLTVLGLSTRVEDYVAVYVIPATSIPAQDVLVSQGSICLTPKNPGQLINISRSARAQTLKFKHDLENSVASLDAKAKRLVKDGNEMKRLLQLEVQKVHTPHLQVLIQRACNNLASKLGLAKESNRSWSECLKNLSEDQWNQVPLGGDAQEILMKALKWLDIDLVTTNEDMAKAIRYLKKLGDGNHDDQDLINVNFAAGKDRHEWDNAFQLESVEDVLGWDELFKLASGSHKAFTEFLDHGRNINCPSSSKAIVVPDLNNQS